MDNILVLLIIALFLIPAIAVPFSAWFKHATKRKLLEVYIKALENGQSVPPDLFEKLQEDNDSMLAMYTKACEAESQKPQKKYKSLGTGIICMSVGIGIFLACWLVAATALTETMAEVFMALSSLGIIPFCIGIAFVIIHFITKTKSVSENTQ